MTSARCRIVLFTYRRGTLLRRALESIQRQTVGDWVCEVHNDAPLDSAPQRLVDELADDRIELINHEQNLGVMAAYKPIKPEAVDPFAGRPQWGKPSEIPSQKDPRVIWGSNER